MKWIKTFIILLLTFSILLTTAACSSNKTITKYLTTVGPPFEQSKDDLKVLYQENTIEDTQQLSGILQLIQKSKNNFKTRVDAAKAQILPDEPSQLKAFHDSLIQYYNDSIELMNEYESILSYTESLYKGMEPVEKNLKDDLGKAPSMEEIKSKTKTIKSSIDDAIVVIEKCSSPTYLADSHKHFIDVMKKISTSTDDFIYALQLDDPLRINAASYRYNLLSYKLNKVDEEMFKDIDEREIKLNGLGKRMEKVQEELYKQLLIWKGQYKIK